MGASNAAPPLDATTVNFVFEVLFPPRSPDPRDPEREIWMKAGETRAALRLRTILQAQERN